MRSSGTKSREIRWIGSINEENLGKVIESIEQITQEGKESEISLYITSRGGDPHMALAFAHFIERNNVNLVCIGVGILQSSAYIVLLAGRRRKAFRYTIFGLHDVSTVFPYGAGKVSDEMGAEFKSSVKIQRAVDKFYEEKLGLPISELRKKFGRAVIKSYTAVEALRGGLIDEIV